MSGMRIREGDECVLDGLPGDWELWQSQDGKRWWKCRGSQMVRGKSGQWRKNRVCSDAVLRREGILRLPSPRVKYARWDFRPLTRRAAVAVVVRHLVPEGLRDLVVVR